MNTGVFNNLVAFLDKLEHQRISYTLAHHREDALMVLMAVPGERWEIEFRSDGSIEIEKFLSPGEIYDKESLGELFARYADQEGPADSDEKMPEQKPPPWGDDPLSTFFSQAEYNERVSAFNLPTIYTLLQRLHAAFQRAEETVEKDSRDEFLVTRFLMVRTHAAFLAAIRLAMSGQWFESYPVLRAVIEQAWYALHIAKDPQPPNRVKVWLCRNDDEASKSKCKSEFTVVNVRSTHESLDSVTAKQLHELYETMIDFGAHPNPRGVLTAMNRSEAENEVRYRVGILFVDPILLVATLRWAVAVAVGALKIFQLIFPERFKLMGLDEEIKALVNELNSVFKPYVQQSQQSVTTG